MIRFVVPLSLILLSACATVGPTSHAPTSSTSPPPLRDSGHDPRLHAAPPQGPAIASPVVVALDAATLAALPREPVSASAHGTALHCDAIPLLALLRGAGAMPADPLHGPQLSRYVQVEARDGYRVVYALAELEPTLGNHQVFLTDRCDGKALSGEDGPLRLIAPQESRPARWVRQVQSITVIVAP